MARIAGVNIPPQKRVEIGLTYIYGIGRSTSNKVLGVVVDTHDAQDLVRRGTTDAVDVRKPDLDPLLRRDVDACDTCHADLPLPLTMPRVGADHLYRAVTADDLALLAHRLD